MKLRDYQHEAVEKVLDAFKTHKSVLGVAATGLGKTIIFAHVAARMPRRTLVLAHRAELVQQAVDKIAAVTGETPEIEMAEQRADTHFYRRCKVVVGSVQTQLAGRSGEGRMARFDSAEFDLIVIDEAHRAATKSYRKVIAFHRRRNPDIRVLGVTATPDRLDGVGLKHVFDHVAFSYDIRFGIDQGWLVPIEQLGVIVEGLDFVSVGVTAGDLNGRDLESKMIEDGPLHETANATIETAYGLARYTLREVARRAKEGGRLYCDVLAPLIEGVRPKRTLVFSSGVDHARKLSDIINGWIPGAANWVCGETPREERKGILSDYGSGHRPILCNVDVLTEGYDEPATELVVVARPTASRAKYAQMAGRGTRTLKGLVDTLSTAEERRAAIAASAKPSMLILDLEGNGGKLKLITPLDIAGSLPPEVVARAKKDSQNKPVNVLDALAEAERVVAREKQEEAERQLCKRVVGVADYTTKKIDPFEALQIDVSRRRSLSRGPRATERQVHALQCDGIDASGWSRAEASAVLRKLMANRSGPSYEHTQILRRRGVSTMGMTAAQAAAEVQKIGVQEGWFRPARSVPA